MLLWIYFILIFLLMTSTGASFIDIYPVSMRKTSLKQSIQSSDLVNLIRSKTAQHDSAFSTAVQLLESMKSSPSCSRIAAMKLLTSCQGLSSSDSYGGAEIANTLDRVKSIYAARLALCELSEAKASIPLSCSSIQIAYDKKHNESSVDLMNIADDFSGTVVEGCLRGLESRPQWWTSYSNSRQNAIVICQAARVEIEKEEIITLHQSLAKNAANLNSALQTVLHDAASENAQHKAFMEAVQELRNQLKMEIQEDRDQARNFFSGFLHDFEGAFGASVSKVLSLLSSVEADSTALTKGMKTSVKDVSQLREQINGMYSDMERHNSELKDLQRKDLRDVESNHQLTLFVQSSLNNLQERVAGVDGALEWLVNRFAAIHEQESLILERLHAFEAHLNKSEAQATELLETQTQHAKAIETQAQAQEVLGANAKVVYVMLEKLITRAANLESAIEETAASFQGLQNLDGIFGINMSVWTVISLIFSMTAVQHPRIAGIVSIFAGLALVCRVFSFIAPFSFPTHF